jgi:kynurenine formamidase
MRNKHAHRFSNSPLGAYQWVDLTHPLTSKMPTWDGHCGFFLQDTLTYQECQTDCQFRVQSLEMMAGVGTHIDAPAHCFPNGKTIEKLSLETLISPCVVIDLSSKAHENYLFDLSSIEQFEKTHGSIDKNTFVIFRSGWDRFWNDPEKYHNQYRFPSVSKQAAEYLVAKDVVGIGIDTLSPDRPESGFPVHQVVLGAGKFIVENVAHAQLMPATGGSVWILPIPIVDGTEAPIRLLGMF